MTKSFAYIDGKVVSEISEGEVSRYLKDAHLLWVDIEDPDEKDIDILEDVFKFHELSIEDCIFPNNQPKIDDFDDYLFVVVHCLINLEVCELNIFVGKNYIVTVHEREIPTLSNIINRAKKDDKLFKGSPCFVFHAIFDGIIDSFFSLIDRLDMEIDNASQEAIESPSQKAMSKIFSLRQRVVLLRKTILPQQVIVNNIIKKPLPLIKEETIPYFKDINDHINKINSLLEVCRDNVTHSLEVGFGNISNQLAYTVKILTIIATILLPLQVITGYYGMNVALPEFKMGLRGVFIVISLMISVPIGMYLYLKKKRLL